MSPVRAGNARFQLVSEHQDVSFFPSLSPWALKFHPGALEVVVRGKKSTEEVDKETVEIDDILNI